MPRYNHDIIYCPSIRTRTSISECDDFIDPNKQCIIPYDLVLDYEKKRNELGLPMGAKFLCIVFCPKCRYNVPVGLYNQYYMEHLYGDKNCFVCDKQLVRFYLMK